jgi:type IV pilus assembly protein PilX
MKHLLVTKRGDLKNRQRGAVLIVALLFLVILTMLGVTAMTGTTMEQRMAGNTRDLAVALQSAEAAMRDARRDINGQYFTGAPGRTPSMHISQFGDGTGSDNGSCSTTAKGLCRPPAYTPVTNALLPSALNIDSTASYAVYGTYTGAPQVVGVSNQPRYLIEIFCLPQHGASIGSAPCKFYRITARGYGSNPNSQISLQEIFLSL